MKKLKLFHLFGQDYEQIVHRIEKSRRKKELKEAVTVFTGIGRFAILSSDNEINAILNEAGCRELSHDSVMLNAITNDPDIFKYCYGNQHLLQQLN